MRILLRLVLLATAVALGMPFAGCGEARLSSGEEEAGRSGERPDFDAGPDVAADAADAGVTDAAEEDAPIVAPENATCVLIPSVGGDLFVGVESSLQLGVYQYDLASGEVMPGARIGFTLRDDSVDATLSSANVRSDEDGLAAVRLNAGTTPGWATVEIASDCAQPVELEVEVLELPTGNVTVRFNYPFRDLYDVSPVRVRMFETDLRACRDVARGEIPREELLEQSATNVASTTTFSALRTDVAYTFVALGIGELGELAAQGCADNVFVREGRTEELTIDMFLLPLDPGGDYDVLSNWDFRDAIAESGEVGQIIVDVLDVFEDPGAGLLGFLLDLVEAYVGGIISTVIDVFLDITGLDSLIAGAINSLIDSSPFLSDIVTIGRDLRAIIAELEVISELSIGKLGSDFELFGVDEWIGLSLYWRLGCEPDDPPDCGRIPIVLDTADLGLLRGDWTGRVRGRDGLDIDRHPIDFEYGRLILYVLEYLVLPAITGDEGPVTLEDLMYRIFQCEQLGNAIIGNNNCICAFGACVCDTDIEGFCEDFIGFAFGGIFRTFVEALSFDAVLDIRGEAELRNLNTDLDVDALWNGRYYGNIYIGEAPTPFNAEWCGVNELYEVAVEDYCLEGGRIITE